MYQSRTRRVGLAVALAVAGVWSCTNRPQSAQAMPGEESLSSQDRLLLASAKVALPPAGITRASLPSPDSAGAGLFAQYCVTCHALPTPLAHAAVDWPRVLRRMWLRMELLDSLQVPKPDASERLVMLRYAEDHAMQVSASQLPDLPGRTLFVDTCARCHALADPMQHTPDDWATVVRRMMGHMEDIAGMSISPTDLSRLVSYLSEVSKRPA